MRDETCRTSYANVEEILQAFRGRSPVNRFVVTIFLQDSLSTLGSKADSAGRRSFAKLTIRNSGDGAGSR